MNKKYLISLIIITIMIFTLSCGKEEKTDEENITEEMLQESIDDIKIGNDITQVEMERALRKFTTSILLPKTAEEMVEAVDGLKDYLTDNEHRSLLTQINFNDRQIGTLKDIKVHYGNPNYTETGQPKQVVTATVDDSNRGLIEYIIEFSLNGEFEIYQHKVWVEQDN